MELTEERLAAGFHGLPRLLVTIPLTLWLLAGPLALAQEEGTFNLDLQFGSIAGSTLWPGKAIPVDLAVSGVPAQSCFEKCMVEADLSLLLVPEGFGKPVPLTLKPSFPQTGLEWSGYNCPNTPLDQPYDQVRQIPTLIPCSIKSGNYSVRAKLTLRLRGCDEVIPYHEYSVAVNGSSVDSSCQAVSEDIIFPHNYVCDIPTGIEFKIGQIIPRGGGALGHFCYYFETSVENDCGTGCVSTGKPVVAVGMGVGFNAVIPSAPLFRESGSFYGLGVDLGIQVSRRLGLHLTMSSAEGDVLIDEGTASEGRYVIGTLGPRVSLLQRGRVSLNVSPLVAYVDYPASLEESGEEIVFGGRIGSEILLGEGVWNLTPNVQYLDLAQQHLWSIGIGISRKF